MQSISSLFTIILPCVPCLALLFFSTLSHKWNGFWKICTDHKMCRLIFTANFSGIFILLRIIKRDINTNVHMFACKVLVILVSFLRNLNPLKRFLKNPQISNFMKICLVGSELVHQMNGSTDTRTDRHTYMTTLTIIFHNFVNVPKSQYNTAFAELERSCQQIQEWQANV